MRANVLDVLAEARRIAGTGAGAWRLVQLRADQQRPEDTRLHAALGRVAPPDGDLRRLLDALTRGRRGAS